MQKEISLVILAAGYGQRFGGNKQLCTVGNGRYAIMDYTIYDAWQLGFDKICIVLRREMLAEFERDIAAKWKELIPISYAFQDSSYGIPEEYLEADFVGQRCKPWGTGHALLCAMNCISGPFVVANADDFYGRSALAKIYEFLRSSSEHDASSKAIANAMVAYRVANTLSENGSVSRGVCQTYLKDRRVFLQNILEHQRIYRHEGKISAFHDEQEQILEDDAPVSMNLFGLQQEVFPYCAQEFAKFIEQLSSEDRKTQESKEFYLPFLVETLLESGDGQVEVFTTSSSWFGLTYLEDIAHAQERLASYTKQGIYPKLLLPELATSPASRAK